MHERTAKLALHLIKTFPPMAGTPVTTETVLFVSSKIEQYRRAWEEHGQFEHLKQFPELHLPYDDPIWAGVVMLFKHPPGVDRREYSYVVTTLSNLNFTWKWAKHQNIGEFKAVMPITEDFDIDPYRITVHSFSYEGRARGFHARMELKRLLPPKLRKYVSKMRTAESKMRKPWYLTTRLNLLDGKAYSETIPGVSAMSGDDLAAYLRDIVANNPPEWYKTMTKRDLWLDAHIVSDPEFIANLSYWIDPLDFYTAVTGKMNPNDVEGCFKRLPKTAVIQPEQMVLF